MAGRIKKPHEAISVIKQALQRKKSKEDLKKEEAFKISFKHLDRNQGQTIHDWQENYMLGDALETLAGFCARPLREQQSKSFTIYGAFPPDDKTEFSHPDQVPEDVEWARIHVNGKHCIVGHVFEDTFYVVFFDQEHRFWISELKHT